MEHCNPELFFGVFPLLGGLICWGRIMTFSMHEAFLPSSFCLPTVAFEWVHLGWNYPFSVNTISYLFTLALNEDAWRWSAWRTWLVFGGAREPGFTTAFPTCSFTSFLCFPSMSHPSCCPGNRRRSVSACCCALPWCDTSCSGRGRLLAGK